MKTVSVVVPVYYNAESLPLLFAELQKVEEQLHERDCAMQLIFVDERNTVQCANAGRSKVGALDQRVAAAPDGAVRLTYAPRPGGQGRPIVAACAISSESGGARSTPSGLSR